MFYYGPGVPAPWNSNNPATIPVAEGSWKNKDLVNGHKDSSKDESKSDVVPDATMYATWDWDVKDYRLPITQPKNRRAGSFSIGAPNGLHHRPSFSIRAGSVGAESSSRKGSKLVPKGDGKGK